MITIKEVQKIIKDFEKSNLTELELTYEEVQIKLSKNTHDSHQKIEQITLNTKENEENTNPDINEKKTTTDTDIKIKSPLVGTFYRAESPTEKPFVEIGQYVKEGDVLCIIEAMKIMNEITASTSRKIKSILLNDKDVVSFDQVLMTIGQEDEA
ncbi:acetyl-CoA carboxylase biotin carboxyl carrier protein [Mycoplasmatota bacterium]|nr:acetyl-CoA carboxylase biotin carboxyl carrier protein [Mycoplasmatota bacterium]